MSKSKKVICTLCIFFFLGALSPVYPECIDGGVGSPSCEYTYSEVYVMYFLVIEHTVGTTCKEGYYACCNRDGAKCIKTPSEAGGGGSAGAG